MSIINIIHNVVIVLIIIFILGVFEWDKDHDDEQEMVMEPLDALKHRLAILSAAVFDKSSNVRGTCLALDIVCVICVVLMP